MFTDLPVSVSPNSELILGESFRRFCKRSRLDLSCGTQRDVLVLCAGGGNGAAQRPHSPPLFFPAKPSSCAKRMLRFVQDLLGESLFQDIYRCAGPIRIIVLTLCTKRIVCILFLQTPN